MVLDAVLRYHVPLRHSHRHQVQVDDDVQSLRDERASLRSTLQKCDARILHLEENLTQVVRIVLCFVTCACLTSDRLYLLTSCTLQLRYS
jgi:hypothetical protein